LGIVEVTKEYHPDPTDESNRFGMVEVTAVKPVGRPITLKDVKEDGRFTELSLVKQSRLSVVPVSDEHWAMLCEMTQTEL
jgi:predicted RNA-binding protein with PUA-like domain